MKIALDIPIAKSSAIWFSFISIVDVKSPQSSRNHETPMAQHSTKNARFTLKQALGPRTCIGIRTHRLFSRGNMTMIRFSEKSGKRSTLFARVLSSSEMACRLHQRDILLENLKSSELRLNVIETSRTELFVTHQRTDIISVFAIYSV